MSTMQDEYHAFIEGQGGRRILLESVTDIDAEYLWSRGYYSGQAALRVEHAAEVAVLRERLANERAASEEREVWFVRHGR